VDILLTAKRDLAVARNYLGRVINLYGPPEKIVIDQSGSITAAIRSINFDGFAGFELRQSQYSNKSVKHDN
jgi:transposase-like protein